MNNTVVELLKGNHLSRSKGIVQNFGNYASRVMRSDSDNADDGNRINMLVSSTVGLTLDVLEKVLEERTRRRIQAILEFGHLLFGVFSSVKKMC